MSYSECGAPALGPCGVCGAPTRGPLQCAWGADYGPCGVSGAPAMGPCRVSGPLALGLCSVSGGPTGAPTGWIRDAGFGSLGVKGPFACQSHGPSGPRGL